MVGQADADRVDIGEEFVYEVRIRRNHVRDGVEVKVRTIDFLEQTDTRQLVVGESLLVQDDGFAEKISLEEDVAVLHCLAELVLRLDLLSEEPHLWGQHFAQVGSLLGVCRHAEIHLDDVRHVDERLVAREQDKVVERDLVARILQVTYGLENLRGRLHRLKYLHDNAVGGQELWCT